MDVKNVVLLGKAFSKSMLYMLIFFSITYSYGQNDSTKHSWTEDLKISGYFQFQYHQTNHSDSVSLHSMTAGDFDRFNTSKFKIRRSRIQLDYNKNYAKSSLSFDITERGVLMKDAWFSLKDPWMNAHKFSFGMFAMPFGHEIELQSMEREAPERARVIQHLFPGIRDLGVNYRFQLPDSSNLSFLRLDAGIYHGTRGNVPFGDSKDFNGRIMIDKPFKNHDWIEMSAAYSSYYGKVMHQYDVDGSISNYHYIFNTLDTTLTIDGEEQSHRIMFQDYLPNELNDLIRDSVNPITPATHRTYVSRNYHALSAEVKLDLKIKHKKLGKTLIRGEYIWGTQVSQEPTLADPYVFTSSSPVGPTQSVTWPKFDSPQPYNAALVGQHVKPSHTFIRNFKGFYLYAQQQLGSTGHHLVYKLDFYDPNIDVSGDDIKLNVEDAEGIPIGSTGLSVADVAFTTHGFGYRYVANKNLSFMVFYENPRNEITRLDPLSGAQINQGKFPHTGFLENIKDDVFTFRIQYIF